MVEQLEKPLSAPIEDDLRHDDHEYNPNVEPESSKAWLNLIKESEKAFEDWNLRCDNIDKLYANLMRLSSNGRDKQFQMFWANCEVLKPSIYAKPPIPVVVPKFKDRKPVYQAASEVLERCCNVAFDLMTINDLMLLVRDDVAMIGRGVAWVRYETKSEAHEEYGGSRQYAYERVCVDFKDRRDFLHSISRNWREVTWVAAASYLTRWEARERFQPHSGDAYQNADYKVDRDAREIGGADNRERAKFWEVWDKANKRVVWVAEGVEELLDEGKPHLQLQNFYPCPKPAYGTVQRGSLVPVPDVLQYKDQLDEVDLLTAKIHALSEAVEARGFYPAGGSEIADAVQAAIASNTPGRVLVPISNWASFGGSKEVIIWLPIDMIAQTITALVALRKQIIDDIYQIMGLSDIMRGATDPTETLGAQRLKTQYGSTRIRDKQQELVRLARDLVMITAEIICEKFDEVTIIEMSQTQLPTDQMKERATMQVQQAMQGLQMQMMQAQQMQAQQPPQAPGMPQQDPTQPMQQQLMQGQQALQKLAEQPTIEQVLYFLSDQRARAFVLDIETDSTIQADEATEKQARTEFVGVLSQMLPQLANMIAAEPTTAAFCGELLKFATAPFRAGRALDGAIDDLVEQMKLKGQQPRGDDPATAQGKIALQVEQIKATQRAQSDAAKLQVQNREIDLRDQNEKARIQNDKDIELLKLREGRREDEAKAQQANLDAIHNREEHQQKMIASQQKMQADREKLSLSVATQQQHAQMKREDMIARRQDRQQDMAFKQQDRQQQAAFKQQQALQRPQGRP